MSVKRQLRYKQAMTECSIGDSCRHCHSRAGGNPVAFRSFLAPCLRRGDRRLVIVGLILFLATAVSTGAEPVREMISAGNELYAAGEYTEAINKYNEALVEQPGAVEPKFNKANSYYRLDDLGEAIDLFQEVAAESKNMSLVAKAKYNLGNCLFQQGTKQRDSDLRKAVEEMEKSIGCWRGVLDIEPENQKAAKNIEVARLTLKDLLDQLKKQQEEQDKQQQQNQSDQQNQQQQDQGQDQQQGDQQQQQDQSNSQQDPNQPQDPNQVQGEQDKQDPNQPGEDQQDQEKQGDQQKQIDQQEVMAPDATAQQILDKEQRQKEQRRVRQRGQGGKVEKDW